MKPQRDIKQFVLGLATGAVALLLFVIVFVYPEVTSAILTLSGVLVVLLLAMAWRNHKKLRDALARRSTRYSANAALTVGLVLAILIVVNFLNYNHNWHADLTKDKAHTLNAQTIKVLKELKNDLRFIVFVKAQERDKAKAFFDNYAYYNKRVSVELIDPDRDPERARAMNVKKYNTAVIEMGKPGSLTETRVDDYTEEKITNALMKDMKAGVTTACFLTGHGEKSLDNSEAEGLSQLKPELSSQNVDAMSLNLLQEAKIPDKCTLLVVLGPDKAFFDKEISIIGDWLDKGGRAFFALDPPIKPGSVPQKELDALLEKWQITVVHNLILDPTSKLLGGNASVPLVAIYNKDNPITKDFQVATLFPLPSEVTVKDGVASIRTWWLAKSTPRSIAKTDFKEISTGRVHIDEKTDKPAAHVMMVAVEGHLPGVVSESAIAKEDHKARIVVAGTSSFVNNAYVRHGANLDLFLNSIHWLSDSEGFISIRDHEEIAAIPSLSQQQGRFIQLLTLIFMPGGSLAFGAFVWFRRRKL